jgi:hypothetical protein
VDEKSNESPAVRELLKAFADADVEQLPAVPDDCSVLSEALDTICNNGPRGSAAYCG